MGTVEIGRHAGAASVRGAILAFGLLLGACGTTGDHSADAAARLPTSTDVVSEEILRIEQQPRVDPRAIGQLLTDKRYIELNILLARYRERFDRDNVEGEEALVRAYKAFDEADPKLLMRIDAWAAAFPDSAEPYLARATCKDALGWEARGDKWTRETSEDAQDLMQRYHSEALADAVKALSLQPDHLIAYRTIIRILRGAGNREFMSVVTVSLQKFPTSYNLRYHALVGMQPRWGGSYEMIEAFVRSAQRYANRNPQLKVLLGYPYFARGRDLATDGRYEEAYEAYSRALERGDDADYFYHRVFAARKTGRYAQALADAESHRERRLFPDDTSFVDQTRRQLFHEVATYAKKRDMDTMLALCTALADHRPTDYDSLTCKAWAEVRLKRNAEAETTYLQAIELDDARFDAYAGLAQLLDTASRRTELLPYLDRYIAHHPADGRPYDLRAHIHFSNAALDPALVDARKGCELGEPTACNLISDLESIPPGAVIRPRP